METPIRISEAAAITGLHPDTLRRYFDRGVLRGRRTPSGERRIFPSSLETLWRPRKPASQQVDSRTIGHTFFAKG